MRHIFLLLFIGQLYRRKCSTIYRRISCVSIGSEPRKLEGVPLVQDVTSISSIHSSMIISRQR